LIALDPKTGEEVWRAESAARWGSPVVTRIAGTEVVITPAGDVFRAADGRSVAAAIGSLKYATPVVQDGVVYFIEKRATAVRLPDTLDGPFETLWTTRVEGSRHYASPVIHKGLIYAVSREQKFSILDATTGEVLHRRDLDLDSGTNSAYPSISVAGDKIFLSTENGATVVLEPGREYTEVARSSLEGFRSSPVFAGERMYVRAFDHLYCIASGD
jgi:outer membrane protein assembly factor BamB